MAFEDLQDLVGFVACTLTSSSSSSKVSASLLTALVTSFWSKKHHLDHAGSVIYRELRHGGIYSGLPASSTLSPLLPKVYDLLSLVFGEGDIPQTC